MSITDKRIVDLVPAHYRDYAPRFITFLEKYYEWLYRDSGLTQAEKDDLTNDTSWLQKDLDKFIATSQIRYFDPNTDPNVVNEAIDVLDKNRNPGRIAADLRDNFLMEGSFTGYDDSGNPGDPDPSVEYPTMENKILDGWFNSMGFDRVKRSKIQALNNIDQVLMVSLLKHIYSIKGTSASIRLFFSLLFDEEVIVYQPKYRIAVVDEMMVVDDVDSILRDDEEYQEYSYVIVVKNDPSTYKDVFDTLYMSVVHPVGFRVQMIQFDSTDYGLEFEDGSGYLLITEDQYFDTR